MIRAVIVVMVLAGCGQHDQASPRQAPPPPPAPAAPAAPAAPTTPGSAGSAVAGGPGVHQPCSTITAAEVSGILGFAVTMQDDHYRCRFMDAKGGWVSLELMDASLHGTRDICEYGQGKRTVVPGVGDSASYFGAMACVKRGDVMIVVDTANVAEHSPAMAKSGAESPQILVAKLVASRIP